MAEGQRMIEVAPGISRPWLSHDEKMMLYRLVTRGIMRYPHLGLAVQRTMADNGSLSLTEDQLFDFAGLAHAIDPTLTDAVELDPTEANYDASFTEAQTQFEALKQ